MKKSLFLMLMTVLSLTVSPVHASVNASEHVGIPMKEKEMPERVKVLLTRLEEIRDMDKSKLTKEDRKELRTEVKAIKSELRTTNGGLYLSLGAIIIIILLLILIL